MRKPLKWSLGVLCVAILAASLAAIVRARWHADRLSYTTGVLVAPAGAGDDWWTYRLRTISASTMGWSLVLGIEHYESLGPDRLKLEQQWKSELRMKLESAPGATKRVNRRWFAWSWPNEIMLLGVGTMAGSRQGVDSRIVVAPLPLIAAGAATPLLFAWRRQRELARRRSRGLCPRCAYNRSNLPPHAPCPECGAPTQSAVPQPPSRTDTAAP